MTDLHDLSALEAAAAVRRREVSPTELVEHALDRVGRLDDQLGAFVTVTADRARAEAAAATQPVLEREAAELPPLHGVPTAIKDLNNVAGVPTKLGSAAFTRLRPDLGRRTSSRCCAAPGTISIGKTSTPELGLPCYTETDIGPPARTPWDTTRLAGGSSGGAAAAVAGGFVPIAQGSDGGGSIRIPASVCGLVGLKTTRGRVSRGPVDIDSTRLSVLGPLARTVRDAAAFLDAVAVPQPGDPELVPRPGDQLPRRLRAASRGGCASAATSTRRSPARSSPRSAPHGSRRAQLLESLGHEVEDVSRADPARGGAALRDGVGGVGGDRAGRPVPRAPAAPADPAPARPRRRRHRPAVRRRPGPARRCTGGAGARRPSTSTPCSPRRWR